MLQTDAQKLLSGQVRSLHTPLGDALALPGVGALSFHDLVEIVSRDHHWSCNKIENEPSEVNLLV